jgi:hypothetical protein
VEITESVAVVLGKYCLGLRQMALLSELSVSYSTENPDDPLKEGGHPPVPARVMLCNRRLTVRSSGSWGAEMRMS